MNHGYEINSTPKHIPDMSYFEALMDFSTPMSTLSTRWNVNPTMKNPHESQMNISAKHDNNSSELNETMINVHDDHEKVADELLEKFRQHENHFRSTQTSLHRLDQHLCELGSVLRRLQASLDQNSSLRTTTDQLETRLIQMSTKRDQVRCAINHWSHSPVISQTLNDIIQRISPNSSKPITTDLSVVYPELIKAVQSNLNKKRHLIERYQHTRNRVYDSRSKIQQRQAVLGQFVEKLRDQQNSSEAFLVHAQANKPRFEQYAEQFAEFEKLSEEYRRLQEENRSLKHQTKENIKTLYNCVSQVSD